ncbi:MAG: ribonuclease Z [archaeon]
MVEVIFLGTSTALPTKKRNHPAIFLRHLDNYFLFDCGEGTQKQLQIAGKSVFKLDAIFISHLHGDHLLGLGGILQSLAYLGRERELKVFGPKGIKKYVDFFLNWDYFKPTYKVETYEIKEGKIFENEDLEIEAFKTQHTCPNYGFVFLEKKEINLDKRKLEELGILNSPKAGELKEKGFIIHNGRMIKLEEVALPPKHRTKIVYSGDSIVCENLIEKAKNSDLLICDSTFGEDMREKATEYGHMTAKDAAKIAKKAKVKKLVLTHISPRYEDSNILLKEAKEIFKETVLAEDFMVLEV